MHEDHERIRDIMTALHGQLETSGPKCAATFARIRWSLTHELLRHMAIERLLLARVEKTPELIERRDSIECSFREHLKRWTSCAMQAQWSAYCREVTSMLHVIDRRMRFEEERLYPLLPGAVLV
jgi:hypothetical protein